MRVETRRWCLCHFRDFDWVTDSLFYMNIIIHLVKAFFSPFLHFCLTFWHKLHHLHHLFSFKQQTSYWITDKNNILLTCVPETSGRTQLMAQVWNACFYRSSVQEQKSVHTTAAFLKGTSGTLYKSPSPACTNITNIINITGSIREC